MEKKNLSVTPPTTDKGFQSGNIYTACNFDVEYELDLSLLLEHFSFLKNQ